jgi:Ca2+-binding EF-hand superfamily protein
VPGFGVAQSLPEVPGFGVRISSASRGGSAGSSQDKSKGSSSSGSDKSRTESKVRAYAKNIIKKYDRNENGSLEEDEWEEMSTDPKPADRNNDGVITESELTARLLNDNSSGSGGVGGPRSYRFVSPVERLPDGLPDWFEARDANQDGQVAMHEFASSWSDDDAWDFTWHDLNNDGMITPQECLEALTREPEPQAVALSTSPPPRPREPEPSPAAEAPSEPKEEESSEGGYWWQQ